jgi:hypothetical protein
MAIITPSHFDIHLAEAHEKFQRVVEADIRGAHGDAVARPALNEIPEYMYEALAHSLDKDQKDYDAEDEAQRRLQNEF